MRKVCPFGTAVTAIFLLLPSMLFAQSSLSVTAGSPGANGSVSLNLSLSNPSGSAPAGLQWILSYPSTVTNVSLIAGPALTAVGKSLTCMTTTGGYACIAEGPNQNAIANGVVATASATVSGSGTIAFGMSGALASDNQGSSISVSATGAQINLPLTVSSLACNRASLSPGGSAACTVTLSGPAGAGGVSLGLSTSGTVSVAAKSLVIPAGSSSGTFTATAGQFLADQSATVMVSLNGSTTSATLALATISRVSSLQCAPASITSNGSTVCTVTLSKAAPAGGTSVSISASVANILTMPATVVVPAQATSSSFTATVGAVISDQSVTVIASLNGSVGIVPVSLTAGAAPSSLTCVSAFLLPGASTTCTVTLTKAVPAGSTASIAISSGNPSLTVSQALLTASAGSSSVAFTATAGAFTANSNAALSASLNGTSKTVAISLLLPGSLASLVCTPLTVTSGGFGSCTVKLSSAPPTPTAVGLTVSNVALSTLGSITIATTSASAIFTFSVASSFVGSLTLTASQGSLSQSAVITVTAPAAVKSSSRPSSSQPAGAVPISMSCDSPVVAAGHRLGCAVQLNAPSSSDSLQVAVTSSAQSLAVPAAVGTRAGQRLVRFEIEADSAAPSGTANLEARIGSVSVHQTVALQSSDVPVLAAPTEAAVKPGSPFQFTVTAMDPQGLDVRLGATGLPAGATFDPTNGVLEWTPSDNDPGMHEIGLTAVNTLGASATQTVKLYVDSGLPVITDIENGAGAGASAGCSPGSVATIRGRSLLMASDAANDVAGSESPSGTRALVNGIPTAVLFASTSRVDLLCPTVMAGTPLAISVETAAGKSNELRTSMLVSAPGLFTIGDAGTGQALAVQDGSLDLAAIPNARFAGKPAMAGDIVAFRATGIGCDAQTASRLNLQVGAYLVPAVALSPLAGHAGICEVLASIPAVAGDAVPVKLVLMQNDGQQAASNEVTIGVTERQ